jgi:mannose-6-phosphate isomerase-like protein (cupin superfamily)
VPALLQTEDDARLDETEREYEVVGYVVSGRAMLHIEGQTVRLEPGTSYVVPRGARHFYHVLETFTAIEATSPPAHVHGRDAPPAHSPVHPSDVEKL